MMHYHRGFVLISSCLSTVTFAANTNLFSNLWHGTIHNRTVPLIILVFFVSFLPLSEESGGLPRIEFGANPH
ncbi:uncharacterized protein BDZ99DRAFT_125059 [Mytilinidion resinicola]|uniref:Uncharacterized protein n=1 Tax=Mytilinidion resinicola TaxID=574789 RepID=A0A6A6Z4C5_9PEZI|nr:uncharacterized protein BDZ99DRAFT_125059 [Mytilinidion resinicola]KAF2815880.1 hypothetical protein BDZ99DRAFT_125059 [Mytilinidion resinicola]